MGVREENTDAFLLIGDEALRNRRGVRGYPYLYDLGQEWHEWTGLPFVFARWVVRCDLDDERVRWLESLLSRSIEKGLAAVNEIAATRRDLNMSSEEVVEYIESFRYRLGEKELRGHRQIQISSLVLRCNLANPDCRYLAGLIYI